MIRVGVRGTTAFLVLHHPSGWCEGVEESTGCSFTFTNDEVEWHEDFYPPLVPDSQRPPFNRSTIQEVRSQRG